MQLGSTPTHQNSNSKNFQSIDIQEGNNNELNSHTAPSHYSFFWIPTLQVTISFGNLPYEVLIVLSCHQTVRDNLSCSLTNKHNNIFYSKNKHWQYQFKLKSNDEVTKHINEGKRSWEIFNDFPFCRIRSHVLDDEQGITSAIQLLMATKAKRYVEAQPLDSNEQRISVLENWTNRRNDMFDDLFNKIKELRSNDNHAKADTICYQLLDTVTHIESMENYPYFQAVELTRGKHIHYVDCEGYSETINMAIYEEAVKNNNGKENLKILQECKKPFFEISLAIYQELMKEDAKPIREEAYMRFLQCCHTRYIPCEQFIIENSMPSFLEVATRAADTPGRPIAAYLLGKIYTKKLQLVNSANKLEKNKPNYELAACYFEKAASQGYEPAREALRELKNELRKRARQK